MSSLRSSAFPQRLSGLSQSTSAGENPSTGASDERDDAKRNMFKNMRALPTQHYWDVYFDGQARDQKAEGEEAYNSNLEKLDTQIESVQDFWRYHNNTPIDQIKMRESIYLFKQGFRPVWEDRRNINGGSWTFRVPKTIGPEFWTQVQLLAIGEELQGALEGDDQLAGVGLSVRFNSHLVSIWHREGARKASIDGILKCVMDKLPAELQPKADTYFYKKHSEHAGFKAPPELQAVLDSQKRAEALKAQKERLQQAESIPE